MCDSLSKNPFRRVHGKRPLALFALAAVVLAAGMATAGEASGDAPWTTEKSLDTVWTLLAAFLVFFMQAGFAMVEAGFTQAKNACNIIMKNLMDFRRGIARVLRGGLRAHVRHERRRHRRHHGLVPRRW